MKRRIVDVSGGREAMIYLIFKALAFRPDPDDHLRHHHRKLDRGSVSGGDRALSGAMSMADALCGGRNV
jgi:hypothetical protein